MKISAMISLMLLACLTYFICNYVLKLKCKERIQMVFSCSSNLRIVTVSSLRLDMRLRNVITQLSKPISGNRFADETNYGIKFSTYFYRILR